MSNVPDHQIQIYGNSDSIPPAVGELFRKELAYSRKPLPPERQDGGQWQFRCVCALTPASEVLGGVHMDMGPLNFGPLSRERIAYLEQVLVRPEYRRHGLGALLMQAASADAKACECIYIRGNVRWDNPAAIALCRKAGFALVDLNEPGQGGGYFVVKPLR